MLSVSSQANVTTDAPAKVSEAVRRAIFEAAGRGFERSQEEVPKDRGALLQSGVPPQWVGDSIVWGYTADYARYVEEGTEPHTPPIAPLRGWARRVLGDEDAAWAIQNKIAEEGTPAQPYVEPGAEEQRRFIRQQGISAHIDEEL